MIQFSHNLTCNPIVKVLFCSLKIIKINCIGNTAISPCTSPTCVYIHSTVPLIKVYQLTKAFCNICTDLLFSSICSLCLSTVFVTSLAAAEACSICSSSSADGTSSPGNSLLAPYSSSLSTPYTLPQYYTIIDVETTWEEVPNYVLYKF